MAQHDQFFKTGFNYGGGSYDALAKWPNILFGDQEVGSVGGYIYNSLEGDLFDDTYVSTTDGTINIVSSNPSPGFGGLVTPDWYYQYAGVGFVQQVVSAVSITAGLCTIAFAAPHAYVVDDIISLNGIVWDATHPNVNGVWKIFSIPTSSSFTFEINAENVAGFSLTGSPLVTKGPVFEIRDNRPTNDAKGLSFTSTLFTPKPVYLVNPGYRRVLPSDLYTRFRFQTGSDITPQGGINSNLFNVLLPDGITNIKPVLWAYFFGYNDPTLALRSTATHFEIAFNSYAVVLRPSGSGSNLEFAILKFNWGTDAGNTWMTSIINTDRFNKYTVEGTDLGYLVSSNPEVGRVAGNAVVTELAKSDSFTYNSEFAVKMNLKITIRKHLLSDSILDGTYIVNLMINDDYDVFGESAHYDSILHAYIPKPIPLYNTTDGTQPHDSMLMPMMYFKFNNINEANVGAPGFDLSVPGSSKIVQDSLLFKQLNAAAINSVGTSYLY
jgi:hypothetical protein